MSRFRYALLAALALHGATLLLSLCVRPRTVTARGNELSGVLIELDPEAPEALTERPAARDPSFSSPPSQSSMRGAPARGVSARSAHAELAASAGDSELAAASTSETPHDLGPSEVGATPAAEPAVPRKIDFGLDGFFLRPPSESLPRLHKSEFQRQLEASVSAGDVERGLARGNALLGSLNSAARDRGPVRGQALLRVTLGADGALVDLQLAQGADADWSAVLRSFRELAAKKRVRIPPGARGLRVTFSIQAKVQRPSGKEVEGAAVGVARPSLEPNGLTLHGDFDIADAAGGVQRLVYARVISEDVL